jgi:hypothetical protein
MMSVPTREDGRTFDTLPFEYVDQRTPFEFRWGGWYVTGSHGAQTHLGNRFTTDAAVSAGAFAVADPAGQNVVTLTDRFDTTQHLAATSDLVALMTFEHQVEVTNAMLAAIRATRGGSPAAGRGTAPGAPASLAPIIDRLFRSLVSADAPDLREPIRGVSSFSQTFPSGGRRDGLGRSLRDLDLERRVLRYPLSYLIESDLFDGLPEVVREPVLTRLLNCFTVPSPEAPCARYPEALRRAAFEIVRETKRSLPDAWRRAAPP